MSRGKPKTPVHEETFCNAVQATGQLRPHKGLQAIGEGKDRISGENPNHILGSAAIDEDCRLSHPNANRWDYVIGYDSGNGIVAHYVEVHSAETSEVTKIKKKLDWLQALLQEEPQRLLARFDKKFHWIASGRINIPQHTPEYRTLHKRGILGPVKFLKLT